VALHDAGAKPVSPADPPRASLLLDAIEAALAPTHAVGLPDNASAALFSLLERHPRVRLVPVTREGEAFAVASGVWAGGGSPLVVVQNTGLIESGDALRGTAVRMGVPLVFVVTYRGYARASGKTPLPPDRPLAPEILVDPRLDSVALLTEPTLDAWGIPYLRYGSDADVPQVMAAARRARDEARPQALLLTRALA
jgi:sulfopyruvate decarboxylase TPP-binding subunit